MDQKKKILLGSFKSVCLPKEGVNSQIHKLQPT